MQTSGESPAGATGYFGMGAELVQIEIFDPEVLSRCSGLMGIHRRARRPVVAFAYSLKLAFWRVQGKQAGSGRSAFRFRCGGRGSGDRYLPGFRPKAAGLLAAPVEKPQTSSL